MTSFDDARGASSDAPTGVPATGRDDGQMTLSAPDGTDTWWWSCARTALLTEARSGRVFAADDLQEQYGLLDPDHPSRWGALFRTAVTEGLIAHVDYRRSRRPSRAGGVLRTWRGVHRD